LTPALQRSFSRGSVTLSLEARNGSVGQSTTRPQCRLVARPGGRCTVDMEEPTTGRTSPRGDDLQLHRHHWRSQRYCTGNAGAPRQRPRRLSSSSSLINTAIRPAPTSSSETSSRASSAGNTATRSLDRGARTRRAAQRNQKRASQFAR
jgi:hypothetical protein